MIAVQKSCINASAVAVFVEWRIVVFLDIVSFHRGISTLGASFCIVAKMPFRVIFCSYRDFADITNRTHVVILSVNNVLCSRL